MCQQILKVWQSSATTLMRLGAMDFTIGRFGICRPRPLKSLMDRYPRMLTSWGRPGWNGPQPPFGTHRYQFYMYALDTTLDLPDNTKPKELIAALTPHIISQAVLTGKFGVLDIFRWD